MPTRMRAPSSAPLTDRRNTQDPFPDLPGIARTCVTRGLPQYFLGLTAAAAPQQQPLEYDTEAGTDLIGFGVGAISRAGNMFFQNFEDLESYEDAIAADRLPVSRGYVREKRQ